MAPVFRFNNLMFRYYETFRYDGSRFNDGSDNELRSKG